MADRDPCEFTAEPQPGPDPGSLRPPGQARQSAAGPVSEVDRQTVAIDRRAPQYVVDIDGTSLKEAGFGDHIRQVSVEETIDLIPMAKIVLHNIKHGITDEPLWKENSKVVIRTGYAKTGIVNRGTFYLTEPEWDFDQGREPRVILTAFGEIVVMARHEERRVYEGMTDSDIAREIAGRHGFGADVDDTPVLHEHVAQVNRTDAQFLLKRARLHGFEFYVMDGIMHWHAPRFEDSGIRLIYNDGEQSQMNKIRVGSRTHFMGQEVLATQLDPLTKELIDVMSEEQDDPITAEGRKDGIASKELVTLNGVQPLRYMVGEGHEQNADALKKQAEAYSQHSRWLVGGTANAIGLEKLRGGQMIEIVGVGKASGFYRAMAVRHNIENGYDLEFDIGRSWQGKPGRSRLPKSARPISSPFTAGGRFDVSSQSVQAGVVG